MTDTFRDVAPGGIYTFQMEVTLLANSINMMSLALVSIKLNSQVADINNMLHSNTSARFSGNPNFHSTVSDMCELNDVKAKLDIPRWPSIVISRVDAPIVSNTANKSRRTKRTHLEPSRERVIS